MFGITDDVRINKVKPLIPPAILMEELPLSEDNIEQILKYRKDVNDCLYGKSDKLLVVVGPCSIDNPEAAIEYAKKLKELSDKLSDKLCIVMRVYFEKPRTTVGWKGIINDPGLNNSFEVNKGLRIARKLLLDITDIGLPAGCEFLDTIMPQFYADLMSWGAIGARTTESQCHRELASGLSAAIGFKNGTGGNIQVAIDAIGAASFPHHFLSVTKQGCAAIVETKGNPDCHIILRGGSDGTNYDKESIAKTVELLNAKNYTERVMIDCSHANSNKDHNLQGNVAKETVKSFEGRAGNVFGIMIESYLKSGNQKVHDGQVDEFGKSVTDACISWEETETLLTELADSI